MDIISEDGSAPSVQIPQMLLNDLTLTQYEVQVQTGSALPQSASAIAATTIQLAEKGVLGDVNSIDTKEIILKSLDYPHYRAIIDKLKAEEERATSVPIEPRFEDYLKNVNITLSDILSLISTLSPQIQEQAMYQITDALGLTDGNPDLEDEIPQMPNVGDQGIELNFN